MRWAVVSDIHGNLPALQAVMAEIAAAGVDGVVNLGDALSGPLWPAETADGLIAAGWPTLRGNHERQLLGDPARMGWSDAQTWPFLTAAHLAWLAALPAQRTLADGVVWAVHGSPGDDLQYLLETVTPGHGQHGSPGIRAATAGEIAGRIGTPPPAARVLLCGHSHVPRLAWHGPRDLLLLNPGSVGLPAFDDDHGHRHDVETGSPHARWALLERGAHGWHAQLRATAYDHEAAARRAEALGRGDWADALRTGRVGRSEAQARRAAAAAGGHSALSNRSPT